MDSYLGPFWRWLLFIIIQGILCVVASNYWSYEIVFWHFNASRSITDARVLCLSLIYWMATLGYLFHEQNLHEGIKLYVIEDKGYSLLPWLIIWYKQIGMWRFMLKAFTIGSFHARITIKNNFSILKKMFKEFFIKSKS